MEDNRWIAWRMHTARRWEDLKDLMYLTKIDFIDHDHKILLNYAMKLNQLMLKLDKDYSLSLLDEVKELLIELYKYAEEHFTREEVFMSRNDLPNSDKHIMEHNRILEILKSAIEDFNKGKLNISHQLKKDIMTWLIHHINDFDYNFFELKNWSENLISAGNYSDVREIIGLIGVTDIDEQHRDITEIALEFCQVEDDQKLQEQLFKSMMEKVSVHFDYEEVFMNEHSIYDEKHIKLHGQFKNVLSEYYDLLVKKELDIHKFKLWLLDWWINHINVTDFDGFHIDKWLEDAIAGASSIEDMKKLLRYTGIDTIDDDHIRVMEKTFDLVKHIDEGQYKKEEFEDLFTCIYKMAEEHFHREERIMKKYNMSDYLQHLNEHKNVLNRLANILENLKSNRLFLSSNIKTTILDWWINHTNTIDFRTFVLDVDEETLEKIREEEHIE
jgi:hemerythrin-like metal-binding protein